MKIECREPPCLHVVFDKRRKIYAVFYEDSRGEIVWVEKEKVMDAAKRLEELEAQEFIEAKGNQIDKLARIYLSASPEEESWYENP